MTIMKTIRIVPCLILVCILVFVSSGCSKYIKNPKMKQLPITEDSGLADGAVTATNASVADVHTVGKEAEDMTSPTGSEKPDEMAPEIRDVKKVSGQNMIAEFEGQTILFEGGAKSSKNEPMPKNNGGGDILLNFDDADLPEVIREFADMLGINYMLDPSVTGKVTIHSAVPMESKQLYPVFLQVLDNNGLTAVQVGEIYRIGKSKDAPRMPLLSRIGRSADETGAGQRFIMQVVPLKYISSQQMIKLITPFISVDGTVAPYDDMNVMILVDKEVNILKVLKLVEVFDVDVFSETNNAIYRLAFVDAKETVKVVQELVAATSSDVQKETKIISVERLNALIVFSKKQKIFEIIESFLKTLDVPTYNVEPQIYVYSVRNGRADELSTLLGTVFSTAESERKKASQTDTKTPSEAQQEIGNPFAVPATRTTKGEGTFAGSSVGSGSLKGEVKITADEIRNALIIEAIPSDFFIIESILNKLDVLPRQVLIEVVLAEIQLDENTTLGVNWTYDSREEIGESSLNGIVGETGLSYLIGEADRWTQKLDAFAQDGKVNVIASPSVLASDNKEASINISDEIPIASTQYETTGDVNPILQTNIQYRNTGVILTVTPHINEFGLVSMDINHELSETGDSISVGGTSLTSFSKRSVQTTLTVNNNQTIVIGGLIREKTGKTKTGVPILKDVPLLGALFRKSADIKDKKELIILITPRVIVSLDDVDAVTEEFKSKVSGIVRYSPN